MLILQITELSANPEVEEIMVKENVINTDILMKGIIIKAVSSAVHKIKMVS